MQELYPIKSMPGMFFFFLWLLLLAPLFLMTKNTNLIKFELYGFNYWLKIGVISFSVFLLPVMVFYEGIQGVPASTAGIILLLEPISATITANLLFHQKITTSIISGGFFILLSNYIVVGGVNGVDSVPNRE